LIDLLTDSLTHSLTHYILWTKRRTNSLIK